MSFSDTVIGVWTLDEILEEETATKDFIVYASSSSVVATPSYAKFQTFNLFDNKLISRSGLLFEQDKYYNADNDFDFTASTNYYSLGISFYWHSPKALGFVKHAIHKNLTPKQAPILAKTTTTVDSNGLETVSASSGEFIVVETGYSNTQNVVKVFLCGTNGNPTHVFQSKPYDIGLHHVFIEMTAYSNASSTIRINIDGDRGDTHIAPSAMANTTADFTINKVGFGYTAHKTTQSGAIIGDLVLLNGGTSIYGQDLATKVIQFGWEYITVDSLRELDAVFHGISYYQPTTVSTTHLFVDGGNVYAARSNGDIVRGFQPIWDNEFNYSSPQSVNGLQVGITDALNKVEWSTSGLKVTGTTIKI